MDFGVILSIGHAMDERELRGLFTEIGCIMEGASVTALVWERGDKRSISDRAAELRCAYNEIGVLLDNVDANVRCVGNSAEIVRTRIFVALSSQYLILSRGFLNQN